VPILLHRPRRPRRPLRLVLRYLLLVPVHLGFPFGFTGASWLQLQRGISR
jgi:hypothetical protein